MNCKICGSNDCDIIYKGLIREGGLGKYTHDDVIMYRCSICNTIWHDRDETHDFQANIRQYYETAAYRNDLNEGMDENIFYELHDKESASKFLYTGTTIFRGNVVADIGCGAGAFLDFIKGIASDIIAVEPSVAYRNVLEKKSFHTFPYMEDALKEWKEKVDTVVSFDVIEHVEDPILFIKSAFQLLKSGGKAVIGTPTDAPLMRELLGEVYEKKQLFSTQHLWILSERSLLLMAEKAGFTNMHVKYFQRYGIGNLLGWLKDKEPRSDITSNNISQTLDQVFRSSVSEQRISDYIVLYVEK